MRTCADQAEANKSLLAIIAQRRLSGAQERPKQKWAYQLRREPRKPFASRKTG
jgi:hypothetical protein